MKLPFNESNLTSAIAQVGLSLQQYDWLIEVVAWLWPEPVLPKNYVGGRGVVRAKGLRMVNTEMVSTISRSEIHQGTGASFKILTNR